MKTIIKLLSYYSRNFAIAILLALVVSIVMYFLMGFIFDFIPPVDIPE